MYAGLVNADTERLAGLTEEAEGRDGSAGVDTSYRLSHKAPYNDSADGDDAYYNHIGNLTSSFPDDVYNHPDYYGTSDDETMRQLRAVKDDPDALVRVYRALPPEHSDVNPGDWVTLSRDYADTHALDGWHVVAADVPASQVWTDGNDLAEFGWDGGEPMTSVSTLPAGTSPPLGSLARGGGGVVKAPSHPLAAAPAEPMTSTFIRNPESSTVHVRDKTAFGRDVEPAGRYVTLTEGGTTPPGWQSGEVSFEKPLHMEFGGGYDEESNWKRRLSAHYGGKTGKALSAALRKDGFDAIVTRDKYGTSETVVL